MVIPGNPKMLFGLEGNVDLHKKLMAEKTDTNGKRAEV